MKIYFFITFLKVKDFKIKMSNRCPVITRRAGPGPDALGCGIGGGGIQALLRSALWEAELIPQHVSDVLP